MMLGKEKAMVELKAKEILHLKVECSSALKVEKNHSERLRVIPISGGVFNGEIEGTIVEGGADWNTEKENDCSHVFAKYLLKTNDGEYIAIENEGTIKKGSNNLIKTTPRFIADKNGEYSWLNYGVYVGSLEPGKDKYAVEIRIYKLL